MVNKNAKGVPKKNLFGRSGWSITETRTSKSMLYIKPTKPNLFVMYRVPCLNYFFGKWRDDNLASKFFPTNVAYQFFTEEYVRDYYGFGLQAGKIKARPEALAASKSKDKQKLWDALKPDLRTIIESDSVQTVLNQNCFRVHSILEGFRDVHDEGLNFNKWFRRMKLGAPMLREDLGNFDSGKAKSSLK